MKKMILAGVLFLIAVLNVPAQATNYNIGMTDATSGHPSMGSTPHYPTLWSGLWSYGTDYLVTYVNFDLSGIGNGEAITSVRLTGSANNYAGTPTINAYHVDDDSLGGVSYSNYTYDAFHTLNSLLGSESQDGLGPYTWDISGFDYSSDLVDDMLTIGLTSSALNYGDQWVTFNRDLTLEVTTAPAVPEPSTILLLGAGTGCLALWRRRKKA